MAMLNSTTPKLSQRYYLQLYPMGRRSRGAGQVGFQACTGNAEGRTPDSSDQQSMPSSPDTGLATYVNPIQVVDSRASRPFPKAVPLMFEDPVP